jgi:Reverse transcriptase (RNA-dependent DNA polymerase)
VTGTPQGGTLSPLLCNVYLHRLDRVWDTREHGVLLCYCDDAVVMCRSRQQAEVALARLRLLLAELGLQPKQAKTRIVALAASGMGVSSRQRCKNLMTLNSSPRPSSVNAGASASTNVAVISGLPRHASANAFAAAAEG